MTGAAMRGGATRQLRRAASVLGFAFALACTRGAVGCFVDIDESLLRDGSAGDGSASDDAGGDAAASVPCGDAACAPPVLVCCAGSFGNTDYRAGSCTARNDCPTGDYFACTRGHDCAYVGSAGPHCCVVRLSGGAFTQTACRASCDTSDELCTTSDPECASGRVCRASLEFPLLFECASP